MAVDRKQSDELARGAIERSVSYRELAKNFDQQVADQKIQVENLKSALGKLEQKMAEANSKIDLLVAQHRRARAVSKAQDARSAIVDGSSSSEFDRMKHKVHREEAISQAKVELAADTLDDKFAALEKEQEIDNLLADIKARRTAS